MLKAVITEHHFNGENIHAPFERASFSKSVTYRAGHDSQAPAAGRPGIVFLCRRFLLAPRTRSIHLPWLGNPYFSELRRLQCPDCMLAERAGRDISALAKALSCSHLRSCDSRATCHFDHWGSIQENRWKTAIPGAGQFQAMSFAASFRRKSGLC